MDRTTGKVEVTAHNHGFAVDAPLDVPTQTPYGVATVSHVCLNDDVVEGLELRDGDGELRSFSVQYHPEAAAGPHDAAYLFDRFVRAHAGRCPMNKHAGVELGLSARSIGRLGRLSGRKTQPNVPGWTFLARSGRRLVHASA